MNNFISLYNDFLGHWSDYFLTNSIEILFLAIPAAIFSLLFHKKSPRFHYIIWSIVLLKTLVPSNIFHIFRSSTEALYTIELPAVITANYAETIAPTLNQYQNIIFITWSFVVGFFLVKLIVNSLSFKKYCLIKDKLIL